MPILWHVRDLLRGMMVRACMRRQGLRSARKRDARVRGGGSRACAWHHCAICGIRSVHVRALWRGAYASIRSCRIARAQSKNGEMGFCGVLATHLAKNFAWECLADTLPSYYIAQQSRGGGGCHGPAHGGGMFVSNIPNGRAPQPKYTTVGGLLVEDVFSQSKR